LGNAYWGQHKYAEAIQEWKIDAQLEGDKDLAEFAAADTAFHSGGWPAVQRKEIEFNLAQRKNKSG
jgi:hypothetical protein